MHFSGKKSLVKLYKPKRVLKIVSLKFKSQLFSQTTGFIFLTLKTSKVKFYKVGFVASAELLLVTSADIAVRPETE
jgi:hypothetical protein